MTVCQEIPAAMPLQRGDRLPLDEGEAVVTDVTEHDGHRTANLSLV